MFDQTCDRDFGFNFIFILTVSKQVQDYDCSQMAGGFSAKSAADIQPTWDSTKRGYFFADEVNKWGNVTEGHYVMEDQYFPIGRRVRAKANWQGKRSDTETTDVKICGHEKNGKIKVAFPFIHEVEMDLSDLFLLPPWAEQKVCFEGYCGNESHLLNTVRLLRGQSADVVEIIVRDAKPMKVDAIILTKNSPVFESMLNGGMAESTTKRITIEEFKHVTVERFVNFLYKGMIPAYPPVQHERYLDLLAMAHKYDVTSLLDVVSRALVDILNSHTCVNVLQFISKYDTESDGKAKAYGDHGIGFLRKKSIEKVAVSVRSCFLLDNDEYHNLPKSLHAEIKALLSAWEDVPEK